MAINRIDEMYDKLRRAKELKLARELSQLYKEARIEMLQRFLSMHAGKDSLTMAEMQQTLNELERGMQYYTARAAELRSLAVDTVFELGQRATLDMIKDGEEYAAAVNPSYQPPPLAQLSVSIGFIDRSAVEAAIGNIPRLAGKVTDFVLDRIRVELAKGIVLGESIPKLAKRTLGTGLTQEGLKRPFSSVHARAVTIARTETSKAMDAGHQSMLERAKTYLPDLESQWITADDERVDPPCPAFARGGRLGQGIYPIDSGPRPIINSHPNCRCRRIPYRSSWYEGQEDGQSGLARDDNRRGKADDEGLKLVRKVKPEEIPKAVLESEKQIRNESREHAYVVKADGSVYHKRGREDWVSFSEADRPHLKDAIVTHNHPNEYGEIGGSFSQSDVEALYEFRMKQLRAVDEKYDYSLSVADYSKNGMIGSVYKDAQRSAATRAASAMRAGRPMEDFKHLVMEELSKLAPEVTYLRRRKD